MIDRLLSPAMLEAAAASPSRLLAFTELEFNSGAVYAHTGHGTRTYKGQEFLGLGEFAGLSAFSENAGNNGNRVTLSLKVLDPSLVAEAMNHSPIGRQGRVHLVAFDENRKIIDGVDNIIDGDIVAMPIKRGDSERNIPAVISVTISDWLERWAEAPEAAKTTDAAQQHLYPGDKFFNQVEVIAGSPLSTLPTKTSGAGRPGSRARRGRGAYL